MDPITLDQNPADLDDMALLSLFKRLSVAFAMATTADAMNKLEPRMNSVHDEVHRRMTTGEGFRSEVRSAARLREETMTVRTTWNFVGQLEQVVQTPTAVMQRRVLNTMEAQSRAALVAMGWTPPKT